MGNRGIYTGVLCHYLLTAKIKPQTEAVYRGLQAVVPETLLNAMKECISAEELDVLVAGSPTIDVEDWQRHTAYEGYTNESVQVRWFWATIRSYSQEDLRKTLVFVTGSESVGPGGFAELPGYNGARSRFTIKQPPVEPGQEQTALPRAQTCFNAILLPGYPSQAVLAAKLRVAIDSPGGLTRAPWRNKSTI